MVGHFWDDQLDPNRADTSIDARVVITPLQRVPGNYEISNKDYDHRLKALSPDLIVKRVREQEGNRGYNLIQNNCEHFATWARYDEKISSQIDRWTAPIAGGVGIRLGLEIVKTLHVLSVITVCT